MEDITCTYVAYATLNSRLTVDEAAVTRLGRKQCGACQLVRGGETFVFTAATIYAQREWKTRG